MPMAAPLRELLVWVAFKPRTHAEAMQAWQSHCPRFSVWEDALAGGLIELEPAREYGGEAVRLTCSGRAALGLSTSLQPAAPRSG